MGLLGTLFSFSGHINRRRFLWISTIVGIPGMIFFVLFLAAFVGFENMRYMQPGDTTTTRLAIVILLHGGGISYISAALMSRRIRDTGYSDAISWIYTVLLALNILMMVDQARFGHFGGDNTGIIGLVLGGISLFAFFVKSNPNSEIPANGPVKSREPDNDSHSEISAEAIIARAVEERRLAQQAQNITQPTPTRTTTPFGNRTKPGFGTG